MPKRTKVIQLIALFVGSLALPMILLLPRPSAAAIRTIHGYTCRAESNVGYLCGGVAGTDFPVNGITTAFFDFFTTNSPSVRVTLVRIGFTGTSASDTLSTAFSGGIIPLVRNLAVSAVNVPNGATEDDYVWAKIENTSNSVRTFGINPLGISYAF